MGVIVMPLRAVSSDVFPSLDHHYVRLQSRTLGADTKSHLSDILNICGPDRFIDNRELCFIDIDS